MNYKKIYDDFMISRKQLNRRKLKKDDSNYIYYERHHIVPKCLNGSNKEENLVLLTPKEHFVAHLLLTECYEGQIKRKMMFALWKMCQISHNGERIISSSQYNIARKIYLQCVTNVSRSKEIKLKIGAGNKGRKKSQDEIEKIRRGNIGKSISSSTKQKMSISQIKRYELLSDDEKSKKAKECFKGKNIRNKEILQYDLNGNFIREWKSARIAEKELNITGISMNVRNKVLSIGGFIWRYKKNQIIDKIKIEVSKVKNPIIQIDKNLNFVKKWNSIAEAKKSLNLNWKIYDALKKNKLLNEFYWVYENK